MKKSFCTKVIAAAVRVLLALRYRIEIVGLDRLTQLESGVLFLPNHPAEIDPVMVESILWERFRPLPLIVEHFYYLKGFQWLFKWVGALPLPTMDQLANPRRAKKVKRQFDLVAEQLKNGENLLIYPSGKLKRTGREKLEGASFVHDLLQACPDAQVVLVRTTGLWGSQFSRALTGASPDFSQVLLRCLWTLIKNGVFFVPKRLVRLEFEVAPAHLRHLKDRLEFNQFLERWYNRYEDQGIERQEEPLQQVSLSFWRSDDLPDIQVVSLPELLSRDISSVTIPTEIQQKVVAELARLSSKPIDQIEGPMHLTQDLGLDSLDLMQIHLFLYEHYDVSQLDLGDLIRVADVWAAAAGCRRSESPVGAPEVPFTYPEDQGRLPPQLLSRHSIQEAFLMTCERMGPAFACVDALSGVWSYRRLKQGACILREYFQKIPERHVGVMFPSSSGAYCIILALLLARKVPIMINWTSGQKALDHVLAATGIQRVITSEKFLDRIEDPDLGMIEEKWMALETIKSEITLWDKCKGFWNSWQTGKCLLKKWQLDQIDAQETAVILFTSGTESLPKGVPLSHRNLLSNQQAALKSVSLSANDILYGVLPPFHSFGLSVTGLLPLLAGLRVAYTPDPTDGRGMARDIARWKPTLFCCAPSFIRSLFAVAKSDQLSSLKWIVSGAEKTPQSLFDYVASHLKGSVLLEGYGITECSPIVSLDRMGQPHRGVGKPLPGVKVIIFDSTTHQVLPIGTEGEIGIGGDSVFDGYLGIDQNPFVEIEGQKWYASGDRGMLDADGYLFLSGRLKRFIKIGGEMISLGGIEEELLQMAAERAWVPQDAEGPPLAIIARESESDKPQIVLFTTFAVQKEEVNTALKNRGFSRLIKIAEICKIDQIPLMGTGKINYRQLQ